MSALNLGRWALVGPGAVGLYYGGRIADAGRSLSVLARSDLEVLQEEGIQIAIVDPVSAVISEHIHAKLDVVSNSADKLGPVDCVIVSAKSTVNQELLESLTTIVEPGHTVILSLQNGMGNAEFFGKHFPSNPILSGLCFVCVNRTEPGCVENYHTGRVEIGSLDDRWPEVAEAVVDIFNQSGILTKHAEQLAGALWRKLCWNIPFNGLSIAVGGVTTDKIIADPELVITARALMEEVRSAALIEGHQISDEFIEGQFTVTEKMGAYKPSSLIDHLAGKPVELESIWGEPLKRGRSLGLEMPELTKLYKSISEKLTQP